MPYSVCVRCQNCDGFPCAVHGKSDAEVLGVRPALEHDNVTLLTNARAVKLETNEAGTAVTAVVVERDGATERYAGDVVVVAAGAANTAALLLSSATDRHPNGLANGSDQVGRNYMFHASQAVLALSRDENPTVFQKTLGLNDFYFGSDEDDFPLGNIQMVGKSQAPMFRGEKPAQTRLAPHWTLERIATARDRLLALDRGPAAAREPRHGRRRGPRLARVQGDERRPEAEALREAAVAARQARHEPGPPDPPVRVPEERDPGRGLRPPGGHRAGSAPTRRPRR